MNAKQKHPLLGELRLAYERAIAESKAAEAPFLDPEFNNTLAGSTTAYDRRYKAREAELDAGRAFMARLVVYSPACTVCGCSQQDGCLPRCWWISVDPLICSSHAKKVPT